MSDKQTILSGLNSFEVSKRIISTTQSEAIFWVNGEQVRGLQTIHTRYSYTVHIETVYGELEAVEVNYLQSFIAWCNAYNVKIFAAYTNKNLSGKVGRAVWYRDMPYTLWIKSGNGDNNDE